MADYLGYEALTQAALRGVVREALSRVAREGAIGDHHFYITFRTRAPGVQIADHLVERFPEDMTIVIQHQYWDLEVGDTQFEVVLKFSGVPQHLCIPFSAITRFVDPSVKFGLSFEETAADGPGLLAPAGAGSAREGTDVTDEAPETPTGENSNTVVNLDAFRRK